LTAGFYRNYLDDEQHHQHADDPPTGQCRPRVTELDQGREAGQQGDDEQRQIRVQPAEPESQKL